MKKLNTFFVLAAMALVLSACGKNNKVGNGIGGSIFTAGSGIHTPGSGSLGNQQLDNFVAQVHCQQGAQYGQVADTRIYMTFVCNRGGSCSRQSINDISQAAPGQLQFGRTAYGDVAIAYYASQQQVQLAFMMCQDGLFNPNTLPMIQISQWQIMSANMANYGQIGPLVGNFLFGIQYSQSLINAAFY